MCECSSQKKLLIVRKDNIGDYVLFRQALNAFRRIPYFADWHITLYGNAAWESLAVAFDGDAFDRFVPVQGNRLETDRAYLEAVMADIAAEGFDCAISPLFSRTVATDYMILASNARQRIGFVGDTSSQIEESKRTTNTFYTDLIEDPTPFGHESVRNQALVRLLGLPEEAMPPFHLHFSDAMIASMPQAIHDLLGSPVFFLGGTDAARRWPGERFGAVATYIYHRTGRRVLLMGGGESAVEVQKAQHVAGEAVVDALNTSLLELCACIARAPFVLTGGSCAAQFAAMLSTPCLVLGASDYLGRFLPYPASFGLRHTVLYPMSLQGETAETKQHLYYSAGSHTVYDISVNTVLRELNLSFSDILGNENF